MAAERLTAFEEECKEIFCALASSMGFRSYEYSGKDCILFAEQISYLPKDKKQDPVTRRKIATEILEHIQEFGRHFM